jgi:Flp pilus assembly pilin Flp
MTQYLQHYWLAARVQTGQTMAEYAVELAVIPLVVVAAITALSGAIKTDLRRSPTSSRPLLAATPPAHRQTAR